LSNLMRDVMPTQEFMGGAGSFISLGTLPSRGKIPS
jgi:hypothetical protein